MERNIYKRKIDRPEIIESPERRNALLEKWSNSFKELEAGLAQAESAQKLVDVVRPCNLRAGLASSHNMREWEYKWYDLKYEAMLKALELKRAGDNNIFVGAEENRFGVSLVLDFKDGAKCYRTTTNLHNLQRKRSKEAILDLTDPFKAQRSAEQKFNLTKAEEEKRTGLILSRTLDEGVVIRDFAWIKAGTKTEEFLNIDIVGLENDLVTTAPECYQIKWNTDYRFAKTDHFLRTYPVPFSHPRLVLMFPRDITILRDELTPFSRLNS